MAAQLLEEAVFVSSHAGLVLMGGPLGTIRFDRGRYATTEPAEVAWLRSHRGYGVDFESAGTLTSTMDKRKV